MSDRKRTIVKCSYCEKEIEKTKCQVERSQDHYCSKECKALHFKLKFKGKQNPNWREKTYIHNCECCGKEYMCKDYYESKNKYCSQECKAKHQKDILKGKNNPNYGNTGSANPLWNPLRTNEERIGVRNIMGYKAFVKDTMKRDNYNCQHCNKKGNGDLVVHHLDGYNWCKDKRVDINNGVTLCKKCHDKFHKIYNRGNNTKEQYEKFKQII